ncbi:MAG: acyl-CoA thioesterase, partial [Verrucomicrobiota bacterium]|nr:acyl-CoA thioesterase [Verrucomicrobiota bacterium]
VGALEGLIFERHTEIIRVTDGRVLAQARTLWVPINPATGRPQRVSAEVRAIFSRAAGRA